MPRVATLETVVLLGSSRAMLAHDVARALSSTSGDGGAAGRRVVTVSASDSRSATGDRFFDPSSPSCARVAFSESPVTPAEPWRMDAALSAALVAALDRFVELGGRAPSLLLLSSSAVYGAAPGSPLVFDEQSRLPRETVFPSAIARWAQALRDVERAVVSWAVSSGVRVGVLRTASVLGAPATAGSPGIAMDSPLAAMLRAALPVRVLGFDPPCQVVHYDDLVRAISLAIEQRCGEVLNIVGRDVVPLTRLLAMAGIVAPPLPGPVADRVAPSATDGAHLRWRTLADGRRATAVLGYKAERTLEECLRAHA
jgi:nucleoside-diphosphate-sugar epimerase